MIKVGTVLHTKDGRVVGNAVVIETTTSLFCETIYTIKTDFGNIINLTLFDIWDMFYVGEYQDVVEQLQEQIRLLYKNFNTVLRG
jgi:hypothetical protein